MSERIEQVPYENGGQETILGLSLDKFREMRNQLPPQQNLALELLYEKGIWNDPEKLALALNCDIQQVPIILEKSRANLQRLVDNKALPVEKPKRKQQKPDLRKESTRDTMKSKKSAYQDRAMSDLGHKKSYGEKDEKDKKPYSSVNPRTAAWGS